MSNICKINTKTNRCSTSGTVQPELCEMSAKGRCKRRTVTQKKKNTPKNSNTPNKSHKKKTICKINTKSGRCSVSGTMTPELCEMSAKGKCRRKTMKKKGVSPKLKSNKSSKRNTTQKNKINIPKMIEQYRREGTSYLDKLQASSIEQMLIKANEAYRNGTPIINDNEYDTMEKYAKENHPNMKYLKKIGADVKMDKKKVKLPYFMASMDKIKNDPRVLERFIRKYAGPYVISDKLDGISGMYYCKAGETPKLFTRGNGSVGQDISYLLPYIQGVPKINEEICQQDMVIRGELIVPKADYERYKHKYSTSRIMASTIAIAKRFSKAEARKLHFVSYEQIIPDVKPSEQMTSISANEGLEAVYHRTIPSGQLNNATLSELLMERRENSPYDIDGIIVLHDQKYPRLEKNPEHGFAFKMLLNDQQAETLVMGIEWNPSKDGYLKPRVKVDTVRIGGTNITYVTGNNAKFIVDNKIGVGARILLVRSGDVIPKIERVIEPAEVIGMPAEDTYEWNETNVDIMVKSGVENEEVQIKKINNFFTKLETDFMRIGNIRKLYNAGYKTIRDYVELKASDVEKLDGFQKRSAQKIEESIQKSLKEASAIELMGASNVFSRGFSRKRLAGIVEAYPDAFDLTIPESERRQGLLAVPGLASKTVDKFITNLPLYYQFAEENKLPTPSLTVQKEPVNENITIPENIQNDGPSLAGVRVLFTGFRDKELEQRIKARGGEIASSVNKKLSVLIIKDRVKSSTKVKKAESLGIPIMTRDEFIATYF